MRKSQLVLGVTSNNADYEHILDRLEKAGRAG